MSEGVTKDGLSLKSYDEILTEIQSAMNEIYAKDGNLINFDSSTPDGQFTNILAQMGSDIRDFTASVYNSFNPDNCQGAVQDSRYAINYLTRKGGSFTVLNIDVTFEKTVTLTGLDGEYDNPNATGGFIVSDGSNDNVWYLADSVTKPAGTHSLAFRSKNYGAYSPTVGTITTMVTIVPNITAVNNPSGATTLGSEQETDSEFKIRRSRSTVRQAQNNIDALYADIMNLPTVKDCITWVNNTNTTDGTGTPAYTVWVIVEGGADDKVGAKIYEHSCGMATRGEFSVDNYSIGGQLFVTNFDRAVPIPLYIKFDYQTKEHVAISFLESFAELLAENLEFTLNESADTGKVTNTAYDTNIAIYGEGIILNVQISTDGTTWTDFIPSASLKNKFVVDASRITINNPLESST